MEIVLLIIVFCTVGICWCVISAFNSVSSVNKLKREMNAERAKMGNARWNRVSPARARYDRCKVRGKTKRVGY